MIMFFWIHLVLPSFLLMINVATAKTNRGITTTTSDGSGGGNSGSSGGWYHQASNQTLSKAPSEVPTAAKEVDGYEESRVILSIGLPILFAIIGACICVDLAFRRKDTDETSSSPTEEHNTEKSASMSTEWTISKKNTNDPPRNTTKAKLFNAESSKDPDVFSRGTHGRTLPQPNV